MNAGAISSCSTKPCRFGTKHPWISTELDASMRGTEEFVFDISSFDKPYQSFRELAEVEALLKRVYPESEVSMRMASPMEATLMFIGQLKKSGDIIALEYIADVAQYAIRNATEEQTSQRETILIVEDDRTLREFFLEQVRNAHFDLRIETASDGVEADWQDS